MKYFKIKKYYLIVVASILLLISCGTESPTNEDYLTSGKWYSIDTFGMDECQKDDYIEFKEDYTSILGAGNVLCYEGQQDLNLKWELRDSFQTLALIYQLDTFESILLSEIISLDYEKLILTDIDDGSYEEFNHRD